MFYSHCNCHLILGLDEGRDKNKDENVLKVFKKKLDVFVAKTDLTRIHRIGKFSPWRNTRSNKKNNRSIIARLMSDIDWETYMLNKLIY